MADEGDALLVLVEAGRLAHEHQVGIRVPDAEYDLRSGLGEAATSATGRFFPERVEHRQESRRLRGRMRERLFYPWPGSGA